MKEKSVAVNSNSDDVFLKVREAATGVVFVKEALDLGVSSAKKSLCRLSI